MPSKQTKLPYSAEGFFEYDSQIENAIKVNDVSMMFNIASQRFSSLKEYVIALFKRELRFKPFWALEDISFEVKKGDVFGVLGTNGSGKSTLLKIIAGVLKPTKGTVTLDGNIAPLIELGAGFDMELTARENIFLNGALLGYSKSYLEEHFDEIVEFADIGKFLDMPMKNYSSGMIARIAFAIATVIVPDILIVDEVLSVGDLAFRQKCERRIQSLIHDHNTTVVIVSHNNNQIRNLCNKAIWIEKGHEKIIGPASDVCKAYEALGGHQGSKESELMIFDTLFNKISVKKVKAKRIGSKSRWERSSKFVREYVSRSEANTILVVPEFSIPSQLAAMFLASHLNAAILLTPKRRIPDLLSSQIKELRPNRIVSVSLENELGVQVHNTLETLADSDGMESTTYTRIEGVDKINLLSKIMCEARNTNPETVPDTLLSIHKSCLVELAGLSGKIVRSGLPVLFGYDENSLPSDEVMSELKITDFNKVICVSSQKDEKLNIRSSIDMEFQWISISDLETFLDRIDDLQDSPCEEIILISKNDSSDTFYIAPHFVRSNIMQFLLDQNDMDEMADIIKKIEGHSLDDSNELLVVGGATQITKTTVEIIKKAIALQNKWESAH